VNAVTVVFVNPT